MSRYSHGDLSTLSRGSPNAIVLPTLEQGEKETEGEREKEGEGERERII